MGVKYREAQSVLRVTCMPVFTWSWACEARVGPLRLLLLQDDDTVRYRTGRSEPEVNWQSDCSGERRLGAFPELRLRPSARQGWKRRVLWSALSDSLVFGL